MAQNIKLKRSSVAGKVPTLAQLEAGELAINTVDGKLYFERDDSTIQSIVTTNALITGSLNINGAITGSDVTIDQWGSISASLATISSQAVEVPTLDQVTDQGNTTTNSITASGLSSLDDIYVSSSKSYYLGANSYLRRETNGGGFERIQLNGSIFLNPNTSANANNGVVIGGNGYLLSANSSRNAQLNYGSVSGQLGVFRLNVYGGDSIFQQSVDITGSLEVLGGITGSLLGNASTATSASYALSSSYAVTSSYVPSSGIDGTVANAAYAQNTVTTGKNLSGGSITKGTPLYFTGSGTSGNIVGILPADAGNPARMPAGGIAGETIADGAEGVVLLNGFISGVDTTGFVPGAEVFVAVGGGYTATAPTGSALIQKLGNVEKSAVNGSGVINGPAAARSVPNIATGYTWVGASNGVATPTAVSTLSVASAVSASFASTASAVNTLSQNVTIVGNLEVFGTSSFTSVTSSQLIVDDSFISVNVFEPAERFGGLKVYDSGSLSHLATASLAWDSLHNHWVYQNVSGSTYTGGMLLSGPRNTGSLGDEPNLAKWFVPRSDGGDHLENSQIFSSGSTTIITGSLTTTGKVTIGTVDNYGADPDKFLAIVAGEVVYRTGAELLSDIGGQTSGTFVQNSGTGGQARYIMRYADSNSATTSSIYEDTSGNIGINKTVPNAKLDVNGNAIVSGSLTVTNGLITPGTAYFEFVDIGGAVDGNALVSSVTGASGSAIADGISNVSLISVLAAGYEAMFVDYIIYDSTKSNKRAGSLRLNWNSSQVVLDETSTGDIGDTSGYVFTAAINGSNVQLIASNSTGQTMQIIYQYKLLYIV